MAPQGTKPHSTSTSAGASPLEAPVLPSAMADTACGCSALRQARQGPPESSAGSWGANNQIVLVSQGVRRGANELGHPSPGCAARTAGQASSVHTAKRFSPLHFFIGGPRPPACLGVQLCAATAEQQSTSRRHPSTYAISSRAAGLTHLSTEGLILTSPSSQPQQASTTWATTDWPPLDRRIHLHDVPAHA